MNILFIAPYVPSRIRVRPFHLIKELSERHAVRVVALGEVGGAKDKGVEELVDLVHDLRIVPHSKLRGLSQSLMALPTATPMCAAFCWSTAMREAIAEIMAATHFDMIHIEHLRAAHFMPLCNDVPVVFDSVDCLTGLFRQMSRSRKNPLAKLVMTEEAWKLRRYEPRVLAGFDRVVITSDSERDELTALNPHLKVDVVPNGVDTDYFAPMGSAKKAGRIVFSGKMGYHPNAQAAMWFAENVFGTLRSRNPNAEFVIVGSDPPAQIRKLAEMLGITVTGYVNDIRPYLDSSTVAVAPMQIAVGMQNKVLEAMAMGLPVVTTPIVARQFGRDCPGISEAESVEDTIREVDRLLEDSELAARIGREGLEAVARDYSWQSSVDKLESIYDEAIKARRMM